MPPDMLSLRPILHAAVLGVCILGLHAVPSLAEEFSRGQALYENHCQSCHADWAHTRSQREVASPEELHRRVAAWSIHAGLNWSAEEVRDVADYLERSFYHLGARP